VTNTLEARNCLGGNLPCLNGGPTASMPRRRVLVIDDVQESVWSESKALGLTLVIQINGPPPAAGFSWISPAVSWNVRTS
jgi:hypothetical protein